MENSCPKKKAKGKTTCFQINLKIVKRRFLGTGKVNRSRTLKDLKANLIRQTAKKKEWFVLRPDKGRRAPFISATEAPQIHHLLVRGREKRSLFGKPQQTTDEVAYI